MDKVSFLTHDLEGNPYTLTIDAEDEGLLYELKPFVLHYDQHDTVCYYLIVNFRTKIMPLYKILVPFQASHKNGDRFDFRKANLIHRGTQYVKPICTGVYPYKGEKFQARHNNKRIGIYDTKEQALEAYRDTKRMTRVIAKDERSAARKIANHYSRLTRVFHEDGVLYALCPTWQNQRVCPKYNESCIGDCLYYMTGLCEYGDKKD
jgi:hypothetical protein